MKQVPLTESVYTHIVPSLADLLTGFGLSALLEFSRTSTEMNNFHLLCIVSVLAAGALSTSPSSHVPAWVSLCNATVSLLLTLALALNLFSQLCPPSGKELSLIPVYVMLCVPRMSPTGHALVVQCGLSLLIICVFLALSTSRQARPEGDVGTGFSLAVSLMAGSFLQTFSAKPDDCSIIFQRNRWWDVAGVLIKGVILVILGSVKNTSLYHFMFDRSSNLPVELFVGYGILVLFASVQTAAVWFGSLKEVLGRQAQWRLIVRIQHIINALILAAAWIFPLQLHMLRVMLLIAISALNVFHAFYHR